MTFEVLSLGSNEGGQLGIGHLEDVSQPTKCLFATGQPISRPKKIAAGGNHTLLLFEDGSVYATGTNIDGRCGLRAQKEPLTKFYPVSFKALRSHDTIDRFKDIAATWEASVFLTCTNAVYVCGSGSKGELGQGEMSTRSELPIRIPKFPPEGNSISSLSACMGHVIVILTTGEVYGWGAGRKGQLGEPAELTVLPRKIDTGQRQCSSAVCGQAFTVLFADSCKKPFSVLGDDKWGIRSEAPQSVSTWKKLEASWGSVFFLSEDGDLVSWGRNDHGQLGPRNPPKLRSIAVGSEHALAETVGGSVIAWGWGEHGNCGLPTEANRDVKDTWNVLGEGQVLGAGCATSWTVREIAS